MTANDAVSREYGGTEYESKAKKFTEIKPYYDTMINLTHSTGPYSVIGHGDCWIPNFLIRYTDNKPQDGKMIDFQLARYASPALDISFFIYSGTQQSLREHHYNELLKVGCLF